MTKRSIHRPGGRHARQVEVATRMVRKVVIDALLKVGLGSGDDQPALRVARAALATAPVQMAAAHAGDAATRDQLTASYQHCLDGYRSMEQMPDDDPDVDDVGRAVAFFVAVNLHVLHGADADPRLLHLLERQLRGVARTRSNWDAASIAERQTFFERIAIVSVMVSGSWASAAARGDAARASVRHTARQYLGQLLGFDPDLLTIGPAGLAARDDVPAHTVAGQAA